MQLKTIQKKSSFVRALSWICILLVFLSFVGVVVAVLIGEASAGENEAKSQICWYVTFGCLGLVVLSLVGALLFIKKGEKYRLEEAEARELLCSPESFFIGEKVLMTFQADHLLLHGENKTGNVRTVKVPYDEITFFAVKTRHAPHEKGKPTVLLKMPARYTSKEEKSGKDTLVELVDKQRLRDCIEKHGLTLQETEQNVIPRKSKRLFAIKMKGEQKGEWVGILLGSALLVAGILLAIFGGDASTIGIMLATFGVIVGGRKLVELLRGEGGFEVFEDGFLWKEKISYESVFLHKALIESFETQKHDGHVFVCFHAVYGDYYYPDFKGLYDVLKRTHPELEKRK